MHVITISREFGSGGRELGKKLAKELGFLFFDTEISAKVADELGMTEHDVEKILDTAKKPISYNTMIEKLPKFDTYSRVLATQAKVLNDITNRYNCVIVGRASAYLTIKDDNFSIFVNASEQWRLKRLLSKSKNPQVETPEYLLKKMKQIDECKRKFHSHYGDYPWGVADNYDLCVNLTNTEIDDIVKPLAEYIRNYFDMPSI